MQLQWIGIDMVKIVNVHPATQYSIIIHDKDLTLDSVSNLWQHKIVEGATKSSPLPPALYYLVESRFHGLSITYESFLHENFVTLTLHLDTLRKFTP